MLMGVETEYAIYPPQKVQEFMHKAMEVDEVKRIVNNGGRVYLDGAHPEISTPPVTSPFQVWAREREGDRAMAVVSEVCSVKVVKNTCDYFPRSPHFYGSHENYEATRPEAVEEAIETLLLPFLITRIIYTGSGILSPVHGYEISARKEALFKRNSWISLKNERRYHIIMGESLISSRAGILRYGTTALLIHAIEKGGIQGDFSLRDVKTALDTVSSDLILGKGILLKNGTSLPAIEIQRRILQELSHFYKKEKAFSWADALLRTWKNTLDTLSHAPSELAGKVDWITKHLLLTIHLLRQEKTWEAFMYEYRVFIRLHQLIRRTIVAPSEYIGKILKEVLPSQEYDVLTEYLKKAGRKWNDIYDIFREIHSLIYTDLRFHTLTLSDGRLFTINQIFQKGGEHEIY